MHPLAQAPDLLSINEAAAYLRTSPQHLYEAIARGDEVEELVIRVAGRMRVVRVRLERLLELRAEIDLSAPEAWERIVHDFRYGWGDR